MKNVHLAITTLVCSLGSYATATPELGIKLLKSSPSRVNARCEAKINDSGEVAADIKVYTKVVEIDENGKTRERHEWQGQWSFFSGGDRVDLDPALVVNDLSNDGTIVGLLDGDGVVLERGQIIRRISRANILGINSNGVMVGSCRRGGELSGCWWDQDGEHRLPENSETRILIDISDSGYMLGLVEGIPNQYNLVVGGVERDPRKYSLWKEGEHLSSHDSNLSRFKIIHSLDESGIIAGTLKLEFGGHAALYDPSNSEFTSLAKDPRFVSAEAKAVSSQGWILGHFGYYLEYGMPALWESDRSYHLKDLIKDNKLGMNAYRWEVSEALDMNEAGQIVACGFDLNSDNLDPNEPISSIANIGSAVILLDPVEN